MVQNSKSPITFLVCAILLTASASALAQGTPDWNRRVVSFDLFPPAAGESAWSSRAVLSVTGFDPAAVGQDASLTLQYLVDGAVVGEEAFAVIVGGAGNCNCTSGCEPGYCDNSEFGCWCGVVVTPNLYNYATKSVTPGSSVGVQIVAAPGSVPEQHLADDSITLIAQLTPDYNRRVVSFELFPPADGETAWTSRAELSVIGFVPEAVGMDASLILEYLVDGVVVGQEAFAVIVAGAGNCNCTSGCEPGYCDNSEFGCWCGVVVTPNLYTYSAKSLTPGSTVSVQIAAAPGSAPEQHLTDDSMSLVVQLPVPTTNSSWGSLKSEYR